MIGDDTEELRATSLRGALYAKTVNLMKTSPQTSAHIHKICGSLQPNYGTKLKVACEFIIGRKSICSHLDECLTLMAGSEVGELETLGYTSGSLTATRGQERIMEVTPACRVDSEEGVNLIWGGWGNKQVQREVEETGGKKGDKTSNQTEKDGLL